MNNPTVKIPAAPVGSGPVRIGREYTGKHRRHDILSPLHPWNRPDPDTRPSTGIGPAPEGRPRADAR